MKKVKRLLSFLLTLVLMAALLPVTTASAGLPDFNKNETDKLLPFLNASSAVAGKTNGQMMNSAYDPDDPLTWSGITWDNSAKRCATFIDWSGKSLSGSLDLSGFTSLQELSCSANQLTSLKVEGCSVLRKLLCQSNQFTSLDLNNLWELRTVDCTSNPMKNVIYGMYGGVNLTAIGNGYVGFRTFSDSSTEREGVEIVAEPVSYFVKWMENENIISTANVYRVNRQEGTPRSLDAYFNTVTVYTVTFDLQGGYRAGGGDLVQQIPQGSAAIAPIAERANYDFAGWDQGFKTVTGNLIVKALWSPRPTSGPAPTSIPLPTVAPTTPNYPITFYTVNFDLNGGIHADSTPLEQMIQEGGYAYAPAVIKPGYRLVGWDTDFSNIRKNIYTKAIWEEIIIIHEVLFDVNRGIRIGGGDIIQEIVEGNAAQAPEVMRPGYTFEGWDVPFDKVVSDLTVTASWKKAEAVEESEEVRYTVVYDTNGGKGSVPDKKEYEAGEAVVLDDGSGLVRKGYEFIGWAFSLDSKLILEPEIIVDEDVTLYAVWEEVEPEEELPAVDTDEPDEDIPKTGIPSEQYGGLVMALFGSGGLVNEICRRRKVTKSGKE